MSGWADGELASCNKGQAETHEAAVWYVTIINVLAIGSDSQADRDQHALRYGVVVYYYMSRLAIPE